MCPIIGALLYLMASLMVLEDGKSLHNGVRIWDKLAANFTEYLSTSMNTHIPYVATLLATTETCIFILLHACVLFW